MCWAMEPSTPPAKRSATKRLSSDYGKRLCRRLWDAYGLIASRKNLEENRIENPLGNAAEMWPASGRVLLGRSGRSSAGHSRGLQDGTACTASQGTSDGRRARRNVFTLSDVCGI